MMKTTVIPSLKNPFAEKKEVEFTVPGQISYQPGLYENTLKKGYDLTRRPYNAAGEKSIQRQHLKKRMTIWERIQAPIEALGCRLHCVKLQETENNHVEFFGEQA